MAGIRLQWPFGRLHNCRCCAHPGGGTESAYISVEDIEGQLCQLPTVSEARLLVSVKRPDDFIDLAERGVFVFDWTDINRTAREALHVYEPVAIPTKPITANELPTDLADLAKALRFDDVAFAAEGRLDVRALMSCTEAE